MKWPKIKISILCLSLQFFLSACDNDKLFVENIGKSSTSLGFDNASPVEFGFAGTGTSKDYILTMTVNGGIPAINISGSVTAPFSFKGGTYPGNGGTCSTAEDKSSCTLVLSYSPIILGIDSGTLSIDYTSNGQALQSTIGLSGFTEVQLAISDGATYDYGIKAVQSVTDHTFTVSPSLGGADASGISAATLSAPFSFKGGAYPGTGGTCNDTLVFGSTCTIIVTYNPLTLAPHAETLSLSYFNGIATTVTQRNIQGTGVPPALLSISSAGTHDYGIKAVGSQTNFTYTVTYVSGGVPATNMSGSGLATNFNFRGGTYPGTGGTCSTTLTSGTCTIVVSFLPQSVAIHNDTLVFDYHDGAFFQQITRDVQGEGVPPAVLSVSDSGTYDFGVLQTGGSSDKTYTVSFVSGGVSATSLTGLGLASPFSFKGGTYPGAGGTCGAILSSGQSCLVVISYAPVVTGSFSDSLLIRYNDGATTQTISRDIIGTTQAGLAISSGPTYNFGSRVQGTSVDHSFTLTHSGGIDATVVTGTGLALPYSFKGGSYPGTGGTCLATISSGTCTIVVNYNPTTLGAHNDSIIINFNNGFGADSSTRAITGTGVQATVLSVSDAGGYNFGQMATGATADKMFTVSYVSGVLPATSMSGSGLTAPFTFKGGSYPGAGGSCGASLASGTCTVVVNYAPTNVATHNDTMVINYFDGALSQAINRSLDGEGVPPTVLTVSDSTPYNFGPIHTGSNTDKTYTVTYSSGVLPATGMTGLGLNAPYTFKGGTYPGAGGDCSSGLASGTCVIVVNFAPTVIGSTTDTLQFSYNDNAQTQTINRQMLGTTEASLSISNSPTYDFGAVVVSASAEATITISHSGGTTATAISGSGLTAPFTFKGGAFPGTGGSCLTTLSSGSCTIKVVFSPTVLGVANNTMLIDYNDGFAAQQKSRDITGQGSTPAALSFNSGAGTYDWGSKPTGSTTSITFTIDNTGAASATGVTGSGLIAPFGFAGGSYPGTGGTCGTTIAAGSCTIVLAYSPTSLGLQNDTLNLDYFDGASNQQITKPLQGTGSQLAWLTISDGPTFDYGSQSVGSSTDKVFLVTNAGSAFATGLIGTGLSAPFSFKGGSFPGQGGSCASSLPIGSCAIIVTYNPNAVGTFNDTVVLIYNDGAQSQQTTRDILGSAAFSPSGITSLNYLAKRIYEEKLKDLTSPFGFNEDVNFDEINEFSQVRKLKSKKNHQSILEIFDGISEESLFQISLNETENPNQNPLIKVIDDFDEDGLRDLLISETISKNDLVDKSINQPCLSSHLKTRIGKTFPVISEALEELEPIENIGKWFMNYEDINSDGFAEIVLEADFSPEFRQPAKTMYLIFDVKNQKVLLKASEEQLFKSN